jgi:demethylmenaquinone methyltransferase/2-methoxy-6-polyprenyl-1,4-benzoquinol methylase
VSRRSDEIFGRIAHRYDLLNTVLSLGQEQKWRRRGIAHLPPGRVLDLGGGTGAANPEFKGRLVVALDPVAAMLGRNAALCRVVAVGERLPFADDTFAGVFSAFVFRNLSSIEETVAEVARVLQPGGRLVVVDLARPLGKGRAVVHRVGTAITLPLAGLAAGAAGEYWYLHRSLDSLPPPEQLFSDLTLPLATLWRMGPLGFVYGAVLTKPL